MEHFYQSIRGNFTFPQFYEWLVLQLPADRSSQGVEIGVQFGQSAAYLAVEIINSGKDCQLGLVDTLSAEHFMVNLQPVKDIISGIYGGTNSWEAANCYNDGSLDFVFIDADHTYNFVKRDIMAWLPKVRINGIIAGHDFDWQHIGVIRAVTESFEHFEIMRCSLWKHQTNGADYYPVWFVRKQL